MKMKLLWIALTILFANQTMAGIYWAPNKLTNWNITLNNNVAYITSSQFAEHCANSRGQINMDGTEFNKALFAYAMSAKARGKSLSYVVDSEHTNCIIFGLSELD